MFPLLLSSADIGAWLEKVWNGGVKDIGALFGLGVGVFQITTNLYKFIAYRTYVIRPELSITSKVFKTDEKMFLLVEVCVKNVGVSRINIEPRSAYIRMNGVEQVLLDKGVFDLQTGTWVDDPSDGYDELPVPSLRKTIYTLEGVKPLESGLKTEISHLITINAADYLAVLIEFGFTSKGFLGVFAGTNWEKTTIIDCNMKPVRANSSS